MLSSDADHLAAWILRPGRALFAWPVFRPELPEWAPRGDLSGVIILPNLRGYCRVRAFSSFDCSELAPLPTLAAIERYFEEPVCPPLSEATSTGRPVGEAGLIPDLDPVFAARSSL